MTDDSLFDRWDDVDSFQGSSKTEGEKRLEHNGPQSGPQQHSWSEKLGSTWWSSARQSATRLLDHTATAAASAATAAAATAATALENPAATVSTISATTKQLHTALHRVSSETTAAVRETFSQPTYFTALQSLVLLYRALLFDVTLTNWRLVGSANSATSPAAEAAGEVAAVLDRIVAAATLKDLASCALEFWAMLRQDAVKPNWLPWQHEWLRECFKVIVAHDNCVGWEVYTLFDAVGGFLRVLYELANAVVGGAVEDGVSVAGEQCCPGRSANLLSSREDDEARQRRLRSEQERRTQWEMRLLEGKQVLHSLQASLELTPARLTLNSCQICRGSSVLYRFVVPTTLAECRSELLFLSIPQQLGWNGAVTGDELLGGYRDGLVQLELPAVVAFYCPGEGGAGAGETLLSSSLREAGPRSSTNEGDDHNMLAGGGGAGAPGDDHVALSASARCGPFGERGALIDASELSPRTTRLHGVSYNSTDSSCSGSGISATRTGEVSITSVSSLPPSEADLRRKQEAEQIFFRQCDKKATAMLEKKMKPIVVQNATDSLVMKVTVFEAEENSTLLASLGSFGGGAGACVLEPGRRAFLRFDGEAFVLKVSTPSDSVLLPFDKSLYTTPVVRRGSSVSLRSRDCDVVVG